MGIVIDGVDFAVVLLADFAGSPVVAGDYLDILDSVIAVS